MCTLIFCYLHPFTDWFQETKIALNENHASAADRRISELKKERQKSMQLDSRESNELLSRLSQTFRTLELNSNAHELDAWCDECCCIHTSDVLKDDDDNNDEKDTSANVP